jgi:hypothetical protein
MKCWSSTVLPRAKAALIHHSRNMESCPEPEFECSPLRLASPPDSLTRLLMDADGVMEAELDALARRIAEILANRRQ